MVHTEADVVLALEGEYQLIRSGLKIRRYTLSHRDVVVELYERADVMSMAGSYVRFVRSKLVIFVKDLLQ